MHYIMARYNYVCIYYSTRKFAYYANIIMSIMLKIGISRPDYSVVANMKFNRLKLVGSFIDFLLVIR